MNKIYVSKRFQKTLKKLSTSSDQQLKKKLELFHQDPEHPSLRVHTLSGKMKGYYAFSINYSLRVVFQKTNTKTFLLISVGSHNAVYRE